MKNKTNPILYQIVLSTKHFIKHFMYIITCTFHNNSVRLGLLSSFYW